MSGDLGSLWLHRENRRNGLGFQAPQWQIGVDCRQVVAQIVHVRGAPAAVIIVDHNSQFFHVAQGRRLQGRVAFHRVERGVLDLDFEFLICYFRVFQ